MARPPSRLDDLFSFAFHESCMNVYASEKEQHGELCRPGTYLSVPTQLASPRDKTPLEAPPSPPSLDFCPPSAGEHVTSWFKNEVERMAFDTQNAWRTTDINSKFRCVCSQICSQISPGSAVCSEKFVCYCPCVVKALSASLQALSQLPSAAPGSRLDHRQGAGERGGVPLLEEDSCCGVQVGGCVQ